MFFSIAAVIRAVQSEKQSLPKETQAGDRMSFVKAEQFLKAS
jgi:hypothetical protein